MAKKITKSEKKKIISWLVLASGAFLIYNSLREMLNLSPLTGLITGIAIVIGGAWFFDIV